MNFLNKQRKVLTSQVTLGRGKEHLPTTPMVGDFSTLGPLVGSIKYVVSDDEVASGHDNRYVED